MSEQQSNQSSFGNTFSGGSGGNPQTNPFTADLKGEFTSNFGTNTNAVSQIFKDGGFSSQRPTKLIIGGILLVAIAVGLGIWFLSDSDKKDALPFEEATETKEEGTEEAKAEEATEEAAATETAATETPTETATEAAPAEQAVAAPQATGSGSITLIAPADGQNWQYDETKGGAPFQWEGGGSIIISRSPNMSPEYMRITANRGSYNFKNPYPGNWYWQVENADGKSEVRRFNVESPVRRNIMVTQPAQGSALAAEGGVVSWQGDDKVAFYRVEFSQGSFANPSFRFATSGNSVQVSGMTPGQYQMRLGAFSETAGRWEYTAPSTVTVQ
jgi:hypothetical protein